MSRLTTSSEVPPSFWRVARQPKWIAALLVVVSIGSVFGVLAQWQLERTFVTVGTIDVDLPPVSVDELMTPSQPMLSAVLDRQVDATATFDLAETWIVENRRQLTPDTDEVVDGYWLVTLAEVQHPQFGPTDLAVALGFSDNLSEMQQAAIVLASVESEGTEAGSAAVDFSGYLEPTEAPTGDLVSDRDTAVPLQSMSLSQLVNLDDQGPRAIYPGFIILTSGLELPAELEVIRIAIQSATIEVNWLTAFYAIEWIIFIGFAFYIWWRLVTDARMRSVIRE